MIDIPKIRPSMRTAYRLCPRKVFFRTVAGLETVRGRRPLVIGKAYHAGLEHWRINKDPDAAASVASSHYRELCASEHVTFDHATGIQIRAYVLGYTVRFGMIDGSAVLAEVSVFADEDSDGGTCDSLLKLPDGRQFVVEDKTTSRFDDPQAMSWALKMNDQCSTYVHGLRGRGERIDGVLYRQVKKTMTSIRQKETAEEYYERMLDTYVSNGDCYREFVVDWTDEELARCRDEANATSMQIVAHLETPVRGWPYNPSQCIGPYGPCEYLRLCAKGRDASEREFKPSKEQALDSGNYQREIWNNAASQADDDRRSETGPPGADCGGDGFGSGG